MVRRSHAKNSDSCCRSSTGRALRNRTRSTHILRWILEMTNVKIMELVDKFQCPVNETFRSSEDQGSAPEGKDQMDEKNQAVHVPRHCNPLDYFPAVQFGLWKSITSRMLIILHVTLSDWLIIWMFEQLEGHLIGLVGSNSVYFNICLYFISRLKI